MRKIFYLLPPFILFVLALLTPCFFNFPQVDLNGAKQIPNLKHLFGTDLLGRDTLISLFWALRTSLFVGFLASFLTLFFAFCYVFLMQMSFYSFWNRILDLLLALPSLLLVMFFQSFLQGELVTMSFLIALSHFAFVAKLLDLEFEKFKNSDFYQCALVLGSTKFKAFFTELLPACWNLLFVLFILNIAHAITNEATLSFFGLGVPLGEMSLGNLLSEGAKSIFLGAWWLVFFPACALLVLILPLLALANSLQDSLGVKL